MAEQAPFKGEVQSSSLCAPTKRCNRCGVEQSVLCFHKHAGLPDGRQRRCKLCASAVNADTYKRLDGRRRKIRATAAEIYQKNLEFVSRYKRVCGCLLCNESCPPALDFHHLDSETKDNNVSMLLKGSRKVLKKEMKKCVVLCANCHRKHHAGIAGFELV